MRRQQSQSVVFLTELFLALTIFALCSSVCAGLFSWSHNLSKESNALSHAVMKAQGGAEAFKKADTADALAGILGGTAGESRCFVYYNKDWNTVPAEDAVFVMQITINERTGLRYAEIVVSHMNSGEIFILNTSALPAEVWR